MVVASLVMTAIATPAVAYLHRPSQRFVGYKRRNLQCSKPNMELRVLTCVHNTRNLSNPNKSAPIFVYALHLVELTQSANAIIIVHNSNNFNPPPDRRSQRKPRPSALIGTQAQSEHIFHAFGNYEKNGSGVSVQTLTILSPYSTMHEDICNLGEDKHVTLIILPFHKQQTVDDGMEPIHPAIKMLNERQELLSSTLRQGCSTVLFVFSCTPFSFSPINRLRHPRSSSLPRPMRLRLLCVSASSAPPDLSILPSDGGYAVIEAELRENGFRSTGRTKLVCTIGLACSAGFAALGGPRWCARSVPPPAQRSSWKLSPSAG
ncbi:hypothetical protein Cni_G16907 [Canna indica]|uniref:Cation/H(+) antiporter central domain-containing protein n=1 Tax=Canna indica TaxID=4628 RepID=A0AAQ3KG20_9LILI|nr:hypothetical protein Cni_G16907 [Canna indica]